MWTPKLAILLSLVFFAEAAMTLRELSTAYLPYGYAPSGDGLLARGNGSAANARVHTVVVLDPISTVYVPYYYQPDMTPQYALDGDAVQQSAYDKISAMVYSIGDQFLHVVDISDVTRPNIIHYMELTGPGEDIELCGIVIGIVLDGIPGKLELYSLYDSRYNRLSLIESITVGSKPEMLKFTADCRTVLVANEGKTIEKDGYIVDIEGSVSILHLSETGTLLSNINLNFTSFNKRAQDYLERGVRWPYRGEISETPTVFSQSIEPEYITLNGDDTKAYICLQDNNAIAVIDLTSDTFVDMYPLGVKSWKNLLLDASDKDGGIHFESYDIYSIYQPDAIKHMEVDGVGYIITVNEGHDLDYEAGDREWKDYKRGREFVDDNELASSVSHALRGALNDDDKLGRLYISTVDGRNPQDPTKFDKLHFFGGRSFSVFRADDFSLVYDSGDEVERQHAIFFPDVFNAEGKSRDPGDESPEDKFDSRSDDKGPECEAIETGELNGKRLLFVAQEQTSTVMVYSFTEHSAVPKFESIYRAGGTSDSFEKLLENRNLGDLRPEDLHFIPASDNPSGKPILLVTGKVSGTLSLYGVKEVEKSQHTGGSPYLRTSAMAWVVSALVYAITML
ncbi:mesenchyme-specific cell surface glycoprotein-like [Asterias rubens]|uniref:mesenchyme-specific cell surface glycoprotein-like n=1 Tax=Asterias rubens TaxID=7604 RepID=UPI0014550FED|nr:mesenchyme-specific cell surface glycoprotein-like [Asterias rubens]